MPRFTTFIPDIFSWFYMIFHESIWESRSGGSCLLWLLCLQCILEVGPARSWIWNQAHNYSVNYADRVSGPIGLFLILCWFFCWFSGWFSSQSFSWSDKGTGPCTHTLFVELDTSLSCIGPECTMDTVSVVNVSGGILKSCFCGLYSCIPDSDTSCHVWKQLVDLERIL